MGKRWRRPSVRVRATLAATVAVAVGLTGASLVLVDQIQRNLIREIDTRLRDQAAEVERQVRAADPVRVRPGDMAMEMRLPDGREFASTSQGALVEVPADPGRPAASPAPVLPAPAPADADVPHPASEGVGPTRSMTTSVPTEAGPVILTLSTAADSVRDATDTAVRGLLFGVPLLVLLIALVTWVVTGRALRPVEAIRAEFAEISTRDLHRRVPVPDTKDEVARLASTMNGTLDRLDRSVAAQRRFVADASHELRSPLALLRTPLEVAAAHPERADWPKVATGALDDVDRLQKLTADLLLLARLDTGAAARTERVDLAELVTDVVGRIDDHRLTFHLAGNPTVRGDPAHLGRLTTNLVDNALRHAVDEVRVEVRVDHGEAVLEVNDDGSGIPADDRERVFDRFTRLDDARDRDAGGSGLGLPLAREVATARRIPVRRAGSGRRGLLHRAVTGGGLSFDGTRRTGRPVRRMATGAVSAGRHSLAW